MKVLIVDPVLWGGPILAQKLSLEGHEVVYGSVWGPKSDSPYMDSLCKGIPNVRVEPDNWMNFVEWADVATVMGSEHKGHIVSYLRRHRVPVCGPGRWAVQLELNRGMGHQVFRDMGFNPTKSTRFGDPEELIKYIRAHPKRYVMKLDQTAREIGETKVGADPDGKDIIDAAKILSAKLRFADGSVGIYLDEMVEGKEVGIGFWFNGEHIVGNVMMTLEGDGGYAYDLSVNCERFLDRKKVEEVLRAKKFHGTLDINGFITDSGDYRPIEFTPRWGGGTVEFFAHVAPNLGELLYAIATGRETDPVADRWKGKVGLIVNNMDEDEEASPKDIILPEGKTLPYYLDKDTSFWAMWPTKTENGWMSLPLSGSSERRVGSYVAIADTWDAAFEKAEKINKKAKVAGAEFTSAKARDEMQDRLERGRRFALGEAWIKGVAEDTKFYWGRVLKGS